jgi:hypothetical protein
MPQALKLSMACYQVNKAFGNLCYLVGSSMVTRDFRDVDVRLILPDNEFEKHFVHIPQAGNALWDLMCASISSHLTEQSGLPVDFQIQAQSWLDKKYASRPRHALGFYVTEEIT